MQQTSLFADNSAEWESLPIPDGELLLCNQWLSPQEAAMAFETLKETLDWQQSTIRIRGRELLIPRLNAWYGEGGLSYTYSNITFTATPWTALLADLRDRLQQSLALSFNTVLANLYRDGNDSVSWHADDEPELGQNPTIASISLGGARRFVLKHRRNPDIKNRVLMLQSGSLLLMKGETQHNWLHQIPKTRKSVAPRINLTYRQIKPNV